MTRVLVLRPEPGASATVEKAQEYGLDASASPLFAIEPVEWQAPDPARFDALLLTSANAVRCGGEELKQLRGLPVCAVGQATAEAAREAGFDITAVGGGGIDRLLGSIEGDLRLLHLCAVDHKEVDGAPQGISTVVVYRAIAITAPDLTDTAGAIALIHSPRSGRRFAELVDDRATITIAAISPAAADAVGNGWKRVETAEEPSDAALLALAARLCDTSAPQ
jgi:uroporphyrinogen-III synthase